MGLPINPVLSGLMQGFTMAQQLKRQALEQQAMQLNQQREKRQAAVEDIATRLKLADAGAKPVSAAGTTLETMQLPPVDIAGRTFAGGTAATNAPAPPEQTATFNGTNYFIPTRDEQQRADLKSKIDEVKSIGDVQNQLAIDRLQKELNIPIGEIGGQPVTSGTAPYVEKKIEREFTAGEKEKDRKAANDRTEASIKSREKLATIQQEAENKRNAASNASRENAARIRAGGEGGGGRTMTPGQEATDKRVNAKRDDELSKQEYDLHQTRRQIGALLSVKNGEEYTDPKTKKTVEMNDLRRKQLEGQYQDATNRVNDIRAKRGLQPVTDQQRGGGNSGGAQQFTAGQRVMYQGKPHRVVGYDANGKLQLKPE